MPQKFENRTAAGQALAKALASYADRPDAIVLALPRGGVPVAHEVAAALSLPMDVWIVRKLGVPGHEELAMGAIALGGACHINRDIALGLNVPERTLNQVIARERTELARRNALYRQDRKLPSLQDKTVIVVDDGLATGATMRAAIESLRQAKAGYIVAAVPVGAKETCDDLRGVADDVICLHTPEQFYGVGQWYDDFSQTSDEDVQDILSRHLAVS